MALPADFEIGRKVSFLAGPTRVRVNAEVVGHEGQFVVTKDADGKQRKTRPGAIDG